MNKRQENIRRPSSQLMEQFCQERNMSKKDCAKVFLKDLKKIEQYVRQNGKHDIGAPIPMCEK